MKPTAGYGKVTAGQLFRRFVHLVFGHAPFIYFDKTTCARCGEPFWLTKGRSR